MKTCVAAILVTAVQAATAQSTSGIEIFGHQIYVVDEVSQDDLMIDGVAALTDGRIIIWEIGLAGQTPYVAGQTGTGGSMCAGVPFIVSFEGNVPTVDVMPVECGGTQNRIVGDGEILFETPATPGDAGLVFRWTPKTGFIEIAAQTADNGSGWDALRQRAVKAPNDFLTFEDTGTQLRALAGDGVDDFTTLINGPPDVVYRGNYVIASNCLSGNCPLGGTLVIADVAEKAFYIAWQPTWGAPGEIRPALSDWPAALVGDLEDWQAQW